MSEREKEKDGEGGGGKGGGGGGEARAKQQIRLKKYGGKKVSEGRVEKRKSAGAPFGLLRPGGAETSASSPCVRCRVLAVRCLEGLCMH